MPENLDEVTNKYFQNVIKNSWTWERLTEEEKEIANSWKGKYQ